MDDDHDGLLSRRRLLQTGAVAFAGVTLLDTTAFAAPRSTAATRLRPATTGYARSRFTPHVGTAVRLIRPGGEPVRATLAGVDDVVNVTGLAGSRNAYTLRFSAAGWTTPLPAGIVDVRHPGFGRVNLYVSPSTIDANEHVYLAAINRISVPATGRGGRMTRRTALRRSEASRQSALATRRHKGVAAARSSHA